MDKKSNVNDLYHVCRKCLCYRLFHARKKDIKNGATLDSKFDLEDTGKLVAVVAASEMTREYLIKQKILPESINV